MDPPDREVGVPPAPGTRSRAPDAPARPPRTTRRRSRALRAFRLPGILAALVAVLVALAATPGSWAVFNAATTSPANSFGTGTFDCPSRTGLPAASLYYSYMPASGTAEPDLSTSGAAMPGTLFGGATRVVGDCSGDSSPAVALDGSTAGYVATNSTMTAPAPFSVSLWFKATNRAGVLASFGTSRTSTPSSNADRQVYFTSTGALAFVMQKGGGTTASCSIGTTVTTGVWHNAVATYTTANAQMTLFLDGSATSCVAFDNNVASFAGYWRFGSDGPLAGDASSSPSFTGSLDETSVYPIALSGAQVDAVVAIGH